MNITNIILVVYNGVVTAIAYGDDLIVTGRPGSVNYVVPMNTQVLVGDVWPPAQGEQP